MMATADLKARIRNAFQQAFTHGHLSALDEVCALDLLDHSTAASPGQPAGLAGFKARVAGHRTGFPDLRLEIENMVVEGDLVAYQWTMSGTHTGPYMGRPPSGHPMRIVGMNLERVQDGQIVEHWSYPDKLALMQQLGMLPA